MDPILVPIIKRMFARVTKQWGAILLHADCLPALVKVVGALIPDEKTMTPSFDDMLEFARYPLEKATDVIVGQDPYPVAGDAHGLAFSSRAAICPKSVGAIFGALVESKVLPSKPKTWDLSPWARQGVILINTAWSCRVGKSNSDQDIWSSYTDLVFAKLITHHKMTWWLWGAYAQAKCRAAPTKKEWCHPIAMKSPSFKDCPHFAEAKHINWSLDPIVTKWYTDGTCKGNGRVTARGAWGCICKEGPLAGKSWAGPITTPKPTNNQAEGAAIECALKNIIKGAANGRHVICTDSEHWINMIEDFMPKKYDSGDTKFATYKNSEMCVRIWDLNIEAQKMGVEYRHVNAWHDYTPTPERQLDWEGNRDAEAAAEAALP